MPSEIDDQIAHLTTFVFRIASNRSSPSQQGFDAIFKLAWTERLLQVIVGAGFKTSDFTLQLAMRRQKQSRSHHVPLAQAPQQIEPRHFRHGNVENETIKSARERRFKGFST